MQEAGIMGSYSIEEKLSLLNAARNRLFFLSVEAYFCNKWRLSPKSMLKN